MKKLFMKNVPVGGVYDEISMKSLVPPPKNIPFIFVYL